jgi:DNA topoisomerase-3
MRLFIAEKPSLAKAIASGLNPQAKREGNYYSCGSDIVTWSYGHIINLKKPNEYNPEYKKWAAVPFPLIPAKWEYAKSGNALEILSTIESLLKKADSAVNAGDADREGQLLIDEILEYFGYSGPCYRILIADTTEEGVKKALGNISDNAKYKSLCDAGKARLRADWLLGMNMTMLYTVIAQKNGYQGEPISVGRVQTPVLNLVVQRDSEIENFISKLFYTLKLDCASGNNRITAKWKAREGQAGLDEEDRLADVSTKDVLEKMLKEAIAAGEKAKVAALEKKLKKENPPLAHSLPSLQIEASEKYGISPADTLKTAQQLYEAGILSYPRSDCPYMPENIIKDAAKIFDGVKINATNLARAVTSADAARKSAAFNDKKVAEHYAIIPTGKIAQSLTDEQKKIYDLSAVRFVAQFWPEHEYMETKGEISFAGETFALSGREAVRAGWKDILSEPKDSEKEDGEAPAKLPPLEKGDELAALDARVEEKKTAPPKRFTEATLLKAMNNIHKYVADEEIKKILKETDGIGTAATQAAIIEKLYERPYIEKKGKEIISTKKGRQLIGILPDTLKKPDKTALWEKEMKRVTEKEKTLDEFMEEISREITSLVSEIKSQPEKIVITGDAQKAPSAEGGNAYPCPKCSAPLKALNGKSGPFWACSSPTCKATYSDAKGKPEKPNICPRCGNMLAKMNGKSGPFWACGGCSLYLDDARGKPQKTKRCSNCEKGILKHTLAKSGKYYWRCESCKKAEFEEEKQPKAAAKKTK